MRDISKEALFAEKKLAEENKELKKKIAEKERIQRFKKYAEELHELELKQDVDYAKKNKNMQYSEEDQQYFNSSKIRKDPEFGLMPDLE